MKKALIKRLFIWANTTLPPAIGGLTLAFFHKLPESLQAWINPYALAGILLGLTIWAITQGLSKWQGIPVEEMQEWLAEKNLYAGRIDGLAGPQTKAALARAIEDPDINEYEPASPPKRKVGKVIRPMGGKV